MFHGSIEVSRVCQVDELLQAGGSVVSAINGLVVNNCPLAVLLVACVADVVVSTIGGLGKLAGMRGKNAEIATICIVGRRRWRLETVVVANGFHGPISGLALESVDEAGLHTIADGVVAVGTEEHLAGFASVVGIQIVRAAGHRLILLEHEEHGGVVDNGLCAPCLSLVQEALHAYVVKVNLTIGDEL